MGRSDASHVFPKYHACFARAYARKFVIKGVRVLKPR